MINLIHDGETPVEDSIKVAGVVLKKKLLQIIKGVCNKFLFGIS